jgi:protocatechuate 3,4-dioxygenase, beta subunit
MASRNRWSRRNVLGFSGLGLSGLALSAGAADLQRTPAQVLGPFYPLEKPLDRDADLTRVEGRKERAAGQVMHVMGRVLNAAGNPVAGARIEIWQANMHGRYTHPSDRNPAPLDPNFDGFAAIQSDGAGRYRFKTIKPGGYPAGRGASRAPHIHFEVQGKVNRLVTQMYFPDEPQNESDIFMATSRDFRSLLVADVGKPTADLEPDSLLARWDIVLETG